MSKKNDLPELPKSLKKLAGELTKRWKTSSELVFTISEDMVVKIYEGLLNNHPAPNEVYAKGCCSGKEYSAKGNLEEMKAKTPLGMQHRRRYKKMFEEVLKENTEEGKPIEEAIKELVKPPISDEEMKEKLEELSLYG